MECALIHGVFGNDERTFRFRQISYPSEGALPFHGLFWGWVPWVNCNAIKLETTSAREDKLPNADPVGNMSLSRRCMKRRSETGLLDRKALRPSRGVQVLQRKAACSCHGQPLLGQTWCKGTTLVMELFDLLVAKPTAAAAAATTTIFIISLLLLSMTLMRRLPSKRRLRWTPNFRF